MGQIPTNYLYLPGVASNRAETLNSTALQLTTGLDLIFRIKPLKWLWAGNKVIFSKYDAGGNQRGYQVQITTTGVFRLTLSTNGTSAVDTDSSVSLSSLSLVEPSWLRVTYRASDQRVQFFTAANQPTPPTSWTQLGIDKTTSITTIHPSTTALRIGTNTSTGYFPGNFYNLIIKSSIDGTEVFNVDFTKAEPDSVYITEDSSNAARVDVTSTEILNGARIVGRVREKLTPPLEIRTNATVTVVSPPSITKTATPFEGNKICTSTGLHTPIFSTANNIYISEPYVGTTHAARLNTSLVSQEDVVVYTATPNPDPGHRGAAIAVTDLGTVLAWPEGHTTGWRMKHSTSSELLSTLTATTQPSVGADQNSYRRLFRNPNDGAIWLVERGDGYYGYVRKWDDTAKEWVTKAGNDAVAGWGGALVNSIYGLDMAFGSTGTIFMVVEWSDGGTGYPRREATVIKSTDDGSTWTNMDGKVITTPLAPNVAHSALPSPNNILNVVQARIAVDGNNNPVVVAAYRRATDSKRSLYVSRWSAGQHRFIYRKVRNFSSATNMGNVSVMSYAGIIYILLSQFDEHDDVNWSTNDPQTPWSRAAALYLYTTTDGNIFNSYELNDGLGTDKWYGGYFDTEALRHHSKIRILPTCGSAFSKSEIWEFTL